MSGKVFLVDDAPLVRFAVSKRLLSLGLAVVEADSVASAASAPLDGVGCALLDLELPDGDGVAIAHDLQRRAPGVPIAFFTAGASDALCAEAGTLGRVFTKPDELDAAIAWVASSLEG